LVQAAVAAVMVLDIHLIRELGHDSLLYLGVGVRVGAQIGCAEAALAQLLYSFQPTDEILDWSLLYH
jgi:hypothetical protein